MSTIVIAPEGEIDFARIGEFRAALARAHGNTGDIVVDLSRVSFIDSSGLGALVDLQNRLSSAERRLAVVVPAGTAAAVLLNLSGLHTRMRIYRTREAALPAADGETQDVPRDQHRSRVGVTLRAAGQPPRAKRGSKRGGALTVQRPLVGPGKAS